MKKRYKFHLPFISRIFTIFGFAILIAGLMMSLFNQPVLATQETCPSGGEWKKVDNLTGKNYTFQAPEGEEIVEWCYKASTEIVKGVVFPPLTSYTVSSTVRNQNGQIQDLSHASFKLQPKASPSVTATSTQIATSTPEPTMTQEEKMVTICHAAGLDGTINYQILTLSFNAVFNDQGGHFLEMGTAQAGHENDFLILTEEDQNRCLAEKTPTVTPTLSETPEVTITATPSVTATSSETPQAFFELEISYVCRITEMDWIVRNPNNFEVDFQWIADPVDLADFRGEDGRNSLTKSDIAVVSVENGISIAPANGIPYVFFTSTAGNHVVRVSYAIPGQEPITLELTNGNDFCRLIQTPDPSSTPVPTLQVPASQPNEVLIPVTGIDLSALSGSPINGLKSFLINSGLVMFGFGMVLKGIIKK